MAQKNVIVRKRDDVQRETMKTVLAVMKDISYGTVTLFIQDGKVLQIDRMEKIKLG